MTPLSAALHILNKTAAEGPINNQEIANQEREENMKDSRSTIGELFRNAGAVEKSETAVANKILPSKKHDRESGNPMMKVATEAFSILPGDDYYKHVAAAAFTDEIEKLSAQ